MINASPQAESLGPIVNDPSTVFALSLFVKRAKFDVMFTTRTSEALLTVFPCVALNAISCDKTLIASGMFSPYFFSGVIRY
jgi:hypothetical protein